MKKDIFATVDKKPKNTVIFEINDNGKEHEFKAYGGRYEKAFIGFLESLGLDPKQKYEHSNDVIIDGIEFGIETGNASYMSRNSYTREESVRKPQNRWVSLSKGYGSDTVRVHINKELDADKLKARIMKAVADAKARIKEVEDSRNKDRENLVAIGKHFSQPAPIRKYVERIHINQGTIGFQTEFATINIKTDGSFQSVSIHHPVMEDQAKVAKQLSDISHEISLIPDLIKLIGFQGRISDELVAWAEKERNGCFNVKKQDDHYQH